MFLKQSLRDRLLPLEQTLAVQPNSHFSRAPGKEKDRHALQPGKYRSACVAASVSLTNRKFERFSVVTFQFQ